MTVAVKACADAFSHQMETGLIGDWQELQRLSLSKLVQMHLMERHSLRGPHHLAPGTGPRGEVELQQGRAAVPDTNLKLTGGRASGHLPPPPRGCGDPVLGVDGQ
jgi:hypothetical protein